MQNPPPYTYRLTTFPHDNFEGQNEVFQTTPPFGSPIDPMTPSPDLISPTASSTNESPVTPSPYAIDFSHGPPTYSGYGQKEYTQPASTDVLNSNGFGVTSYTFTMDAVIAGPELDANNCNHNLILDNTDQALGNAEYFPNPNSVQYKPSNTVGVDFSSNSPPESGQNFNALSMPFVGYIQHHNVDDGLSPNSSIELGKPQPQDADETAGENTGPHYLIDFKKGASDDSLYKFCIKDNGNGTFRCDLDKCIAKRSSGSFSEKEAKDHFRKEINMRPFMCGYCNERFKNKPDCKRHVKCKNDPGAYECQYCDHKCSRSDALNVHIQTVHTAQSRQKEGNESPEDQGPQRLV